MVRLPTGSLVRSRAASKEFVERRPPSAAGRRLDQEFSVKGGWRPGYGKPVGFGANSAVVRANSAPLPEIRAAHRVAAVRGRGGEGGRGGPSQPGAASS